MRRRTAPAKFVIILTAVAAVLGVVAGAILGFSMGGLVGAAVGAALGALVGAAAGVILAGTLLCLGAMVRHAYKCCCPSGHVKDSRRTPSSRVHHGASPRGRPSIGGHHAGAGGSDAHHRFSSRTHPLEVVSKVLTGGRRHGSFWRRNGMGGNARQPRGRMTRQPRVGAVT